MSLLAKAKGYKHTNTRKMLVPCTDNELELLEALQAGQIDRYQLSYALGVKMPNIPGWIGTRLNRAFRYEQIKFVK